MEEETKEYAGFDRLQKISLFLMLGMTLLTFLLANLQALLWQSSDWLVSTVLPAVVVDLTNEEREGVSLGDLNHNPILDQAATLKAKHMAQNEYFSHYAPDGTSPWHWFKQAGYSYAHAGENLAVHFTDSSEVVEAWMNSPTHRANIVNGTYTEIGVGTAKGEYEGYPTVYVVQLFGTPATPAPTPTTSTPPEPIPAEVTINTEETAEEPVESVTEATPPPITLAAEAEADSVDVEVSNTEELAINSVEETENPYTPPEYVVESTIATSSGLPAAASVENNDNTSGSVLGIATSPSKVMQFMYIVVAAVVCVLLLLSLVNEAKQAHKMQVAYSIGLLGLLGVLGWVHTILTAGAIIV